MTEISQEVFKDWKNHVVTKELFRRLQIDKEYLHEIWETGKAINDPIINARNVGAAQAISMILNFKPDAIEEDTSHDN
jgi:hypothetical protein